MYVNLPHGFKGTHMSRFVEILNSHQREIGVESFGDMLAQMTRRLEAQFGYIEMRFPYFVEKAAPVTGVRNLMDYQVALIGEIAEGEVRKRIRVTVPVTTLCPCSKTISERGAHNQRSHVTVTVMIGDFVWIEELIEWVEAEASSLIFGLLKRLDEKYVTEYAYNHPKFVEDMVRNVAARSDAEPRVLAYRSKRRTSNPSITIPPMPVSRGRIKGRELSVHDGCKRIRLSAKVSLTVYGRARVATLIRYVGPIVSEG